jgi:hypothetical protein
MLSQPSMDRHAGEQIARLRFVYDLKRPSRMRNRWHLSVFQKGFTSTPGRLDTQSALLITRRSRDIPNLVKNRPFEPHGGDLWPSVYTVIRGAHPPVTAYHPRFVSWERLLRPARTRRIAPRTKKMGRQAARTPVGPVRLRAELNSKHSLHDPAVRMRTVPYPPTGDKLSTHPF